eukprot:GHVH01004862.1.p1 GENE.GHVH01004862.1~~GHVH01004862.1.p1  ORF type:complete len:152 (-),score=31.96 GHVH01004862.1:57-512(-)
MSSVAALRLKYELQTVPPGPRRDAISALFAEGRQPTNGEIQQIRDVKQTKDLVKFTEALNALAPGEHLPDNFFANLPPDEEPEDVLPEEAAPKVDGMDGAMVDADDDGEDVEAPDELSLTPEDLDANGDARAMQMAEDWAPYLGENNAQTK